MSGSVDKLRVEFDRWVNLARMNGEKALESIGIRAFTGGPWMPDVDVDELKTEVLVFIDLPGVTADRVDLSLTGNMLVVKGQKPPATVAEQAEHRLQERRRGPFERSIPLPAAVDPDHVAAEIRDGVLFIRLQKSVEQVERHIVVVAKDAPGGSTTAPVATTTAAQPDPEAPAPGAATAN